MNVTEALHCAKEAAAYLKSKHGATRVVLFGSVIDGTYVEGHSDIDLYFEGVPDELEFSAAGDTALRFAQVDFDFIHGQYPAYIAEEALATGIEV